MATFTQSDDLQGAEFVDADLRDARFVGADLSGVVMRGVEVQRAEIDSPWLFEGESFLRVNGVDVIPFIEAELQRVAAMPVGTVERPSTGSGRSRRRCGTWSWPRTRGWAGRSWRSKSRTTPSA